MCKKVHVQLVSVAYGTQASSQRYVLVSLELALIFDDLMDTMIQYFLPKFFNKSTKLCRQQVALK